MPHKAAYYLAHLCDNAMTPDAAEAVLHLLLCGDLPDLVTLDEWWVQIVRRRRREVALDLIDEFGMLCECCNAEPAVDLDEVIRRRGSDTSWRQILLFSRDNCAAICRGCHASGRSATPEFKERFKAKRGIIGWDLPNDSMGNNL